MTAAQRATIENLASELEAVVPEPCCWRGPPAQPAMRAAETLAASLGASVVRVDLGRWSASTIGETEKHLDAVFARRRARRTPCCCWTRPTRCFGRRTGVKDAHDRYANLDMSALLARIEAYPGLVLLATNTKTTIDPAKIRRLRRVIDYPPR